MVKSKTDIVKELFEIGQIKLFSEIFDRWAFPVSTLAKAVGVGRRRMTAIVADPSLLTYGEAVMIASYFNVSAAQISQIVLHQLASQKK